MYGYVDRAGGGAPRNEEIDIQTPNVVPDLPFAAQQIEMIVNGVVYPQDVPTAAPVFVFTPPSSITFNMNNAGWVLATDDIVVAKAW